MSQTELKFIFANIIAAVFSIRRYKSFWSRVSLFWEKSLELPLLVM